MIPVQQATGAKRKKEMERVVTLRDKLLEEEARQREQVDRVMARLMQVRLGLGEKIQMSSQLLAVTFKSRLSCQICGLSGVS